MKRRAKIEIVLVDGIDHLECSKCRLVKPTTEYHKNRAMKVGLDHYCKRCVKFFNMLKNYKITEEQFHILYDSQQGKCAVCRVDLNEDFVVDHDHSCCPVGSSCGECVRGLLCHLCNRGLGHFKDDVDTLMSAVAYLLGSRSQEQASERLSK